MQKGGNRFHSSRNLERILSCNWCGVPETVTYVVTKRSLGWAYKCPSDLLLNFPQVCDRTVGNLGGDFSGLLFGKLFFFCLFCWSCCWSGLCWDRRSSIQCALAMSCCTPSKACALQIENEKMSSHHKDSNFSRSGSFFSLFMEVQE